MMNIKAGLAIGAGVVAVVVAAVAATSAGTFEVGGERFVVPQQWLFDHRIPWLPVPEADSFMFDLDGHATSDQIPKHLVLVESAKRVCGNNHMSQMVKVACGLERTTIPVRAPYEKVFPQPDYPDEWYYYATESADAVGGKPNKLQVAGCTPITPNPARPKGGGICTTVWGMDGLLLTLDFDEDELSQLAAMRVRATQLLLSWKVR